MLPPVEVILTRSARGDVGCVFDGTRLEHVHPGTPAAAHGLQRLCGRTVSHVNGAPVATLSDVYAHAARDPVRLHLRFAPQALGVGAAPPPPALPDAALFPPPATLLSSELPSDALLPPPTTLLSTDLAPPQSLVPPSAAAVPISEEVSVALGPFAGLGCRLDEMTLSAVAAASPADSSGVGAFVGRRLTHVDGAPVGSVEDVAASLARSRRRGAVVSLRFAPLATPAPPLAARLHSSPAPLPPTRPFPQPLPAPVLPARRASVSPHRLSPPPTARDEVSVRSGSVFDGPVHRPPGTVWSAPVARPPLTAGQAHVRPFGGVV